MVRRVSVMRRCFVPSYTTEWNLVVPPRSKSSFREVEDISTDEQTKKHHLLQVAPFERPSYLDIYYALEDRAWKRRLVEEQETNDGHSKTETENSAVVANSLDVDVHCIA